MKPPPLDYTAPATLDEARAALADTHREAKIIAGGQSLIPMLNMRLARPEVLLDISRIAELGALHVDSDGLHVGAGVRQASVAAARDVRRGWPLLARAIEHIGHPQIRNRGTVCGSLAHHDPAAELPAAAVALEARFVLAGPRGYRTVEAEDFFAGTFQTVIAPEELLTEVIFPPAGGDGWAFGELTRRHGDFAMVGVAVLLGRYRGTVPSARIVYCGAGVTPVRVPAAEAELAGHPVGAARVAAACERVAAELVPPDDVHASSEYRREVAGVLLERAVTEAWHRETEISG